MLKILVADDHAVVRQGLRNILSDLPEVSLVGEAGNGGEALDLIRSALWDALVLDISMPGAGGLDILKDVLHERPKLPVLVLSMHPEDQFAIRLLKAGAAGYMNKETAPQELIKAIRKITAGGRYVSASLAEQLAHQLDAGDKPPHESLSDREFQVLRLLAAGKTVKEIAESLSISVKTVSTYRARILEKLSLNNNAELVHYAIRHRLAE
jgi:two-component system, NarL family, invasion response regulator UvrY